MRRAILTADPNLPITVARPLGEIIDDRMVQDRLLARLSIAFGVVALLLSAIGLYGILSYGVARRTNEIGIRKALGAQHGAVMAMILRETGLLLVVGLVTGAALSVAGMRLIASTTIGLEPTDPLAFGAAIAVLIGVALLAAGLPAHRASRVDPLVALRYEMRGAALFIPQGDHWIDARCTAGGNKHARAATPSRIRDTALKVGT